MTTPTTITSQLQKLNPNSIVELFELDLTDLGGDIYYFHAGTNGLTQNIQWQGQVYTAYPVKASGFEFTVNGQLPRPRLFVSNTFGTITSILLAYNDMLGAKITRKRTMAKYLDWENFDYLYSYDFTSSTDGFSSNGAATFTASSGIATYSTLGSVNSFFTRTHSVGEYYTGANAYIFQVRARRISGSGTWEGRAYYTTSGHGHSNSFRKTIAAPSDLTAWNILEWDMRSLTAGGTDYVDNTINTIRIDLVSDGTDVWELDYVKITGTNPDEDTTAEFNDDVYYIDRKANENKEVVEFELASPLDLTRVMVPRRQVIQNICTWVYRGGECGYSGSSYFDIFNNAVGSASLDKCGKKLSSCKARFGEYAQLPFGAFPAADMVK